MNDDLKSFLLTIGAVIIALIVFNMFSKQTLTSTTGQPIGSSKTTGKVPKVKPPRTTTTTTTGAPATQRMS